MAAWSASHAARTNPAFGVASASPRSHCSKIEASAASRSMSSLCPTAIRNMPRAYRAAARWGSSEGIEAVAIAIGRQAPDRRNGLMAEGDQPAFIGGPREQLALHLDRVERK